MLIEVQGSGSLDVGVHYFIFQRVYLAKGQKKKNHRTHPFI